VRRRRHVILARLASASDEDAAMSDTPDPELLRRMEAALMDMPKRQRDIFIAHRVHGMSYGEIGDRTGLTVRQVERQMAKAIYKLAKQMDGEKLSGWERWF
jgi:RNA polymerase sigma-70 factor (ECF subfamily)